MANNRTIFLVAGAQELLDNGFNERFNIVPKPQIAGGGEQHNSSVPQDGNTPTPISNTPFMLAVTTAHLPKDASVGFVIGRDDKTCDITLTDDRVSERHLCVELNLKAGTVLVGDRFRVGMLVKFSDDDVPIVLRGYSNALLNHKNVEIQLVKDLSILIGRFDDPVDWDDYCQNYATIAGGLSMARLGLDTLHKTTEVSSRAPVYLKDRKLGNGAYGEVFRVVDRRTGNAFAMKTFYKLEQTRWQEPALLQHLQHKYIVRYVSYSHVAGESAQLIMEFVKGLTLDKYLFLDSIGGQLSKAEARTVLHQLLEATEYFHRMNVTHRDIKPSNIILVSRDPILIKVVDFGLATEMTSFQTVCGTQPYFAPELLSMQSQPLTNKVDMFAIGVVATMLLFRISADELKKIKRPQDYVHFVLRQRQKAIADGSFKLTPLTPFGLILDLLSERPEDRPSAERCLSYAFFQREDDQETVHGSQSADIVTEQNAKDDDKNEDSFEALGADRRKRRMLEAPVRRETRHRKQPPAPKSHFVRHFQSTSICVVIANKPLLRCVNRRQAKTLLDAEYQQNPRSSKADYIRPQQLSLWT